MAESVRIFREEFAEQWRAKVLLLLLARMKEDVELVKKEVKH